MLEKFGERLRAARIAAGVNQSEFAEWGGTKKNSQISYETGKTPPTVEYLFRLAEHGVDIRYVLTGEGNAGHLLDEADALIEAGDDDAVRALRPDLERIGRDPDIAPNLRNRALFLASKLGGDEAKRLHGDVTRGFALARERARETMEAALDQGQEATGVDLGEGVRQAILALAGQLLIVTPEDVSPGMLDWSIQSLVRAIAARVGVSPDDGSARYRPSVHEPRGDFRGGGGA